MGKAIQLLWWLVLLGGAGAALIYFRCIQQEQADLQLLLNRLEESQPEKTTNLWIPCYLVGATVWCVLSCLMFTDPHSWVGYSGVVTGFVRIARVPTRSSPSAPAEPSSDAKPQPG